MSEIIVGKLSTTQNGFTAYTLFTRDQRDQHYFNNEKGGTEKTKRLIKLIMMGVEGWLKYKWRFTKGVLVLNIKILSKGCFKKRSNDDPESISKKYLTGTGLGVVKRASKGRAADTRGLRSAGGCGKKLYLQIMLAFKRGY